LRENHLFLIPLDTERRWFRYHPLFADLLQKRLMEEEADLILALHQRASQWFLRNEDPEYAIYHALQAEDYQGALSIIEGIAEVTLVRSEFMIFLKWLEAIPVEMTRTRPRLLIFGATASLFSSGDAETVAAMLKDAVKADQGHEYAGEISALLAMIATLKGDVEGSIERSESAMEALPEGNIFLRSLVIGNLSLAYISTGDIENAAELFSKAAQAAEGAGNNMAAVMALRRLAEMALISGDLHQAWEICKRGLAIAVYPDGKPLPVAGVLMAVQGDILREWNQLPAAHELIQGGIDLVLRWSELAAVEIYLYLARVKRSMGEAEEAQGAIDTARQISERNEASRMAPVIVNLFQARLWLQLGQLSEVEKWEKDYQPFATYLEVQGYNPKYHHHLLEIEGIAFARLRLSQGRWAESLEILGPLHQAAVNLKRRGRLIEILLLKAINSFKIGEVEKALELLEGALLIAEPQGYVRMFIDEGEAMGEILTLLLRAVRKRGEDASPGVSVEYLNQLLAALTAESVAVKASKPGTVAGMDEPLSDRELEVLRFLPTSLTSTEIAQELYVSPNTIRFHIKNIYGKLGVHQRAAAVERARDLGLI
jgi:LuxR family maltose regulon positive regulatory protein